VSWSNNSLIRAVCGVSILKLSKSIVEGVLEKATSKFLDFQFEMLNSSKIEKDFFIIFNIGK
jgi:hypothetical protein